MTEESRELTFDDILRFAGVHEAQSHLERLMPDPATLPPSAPASGCGSGSCGCGNSAGSNTLLDKPLDRRKAIGTILGALAVSTQAVSACSPASLESDEVREAKLLERDEYFKGNYRLMSPEEKAETIRRLERLTQLRSHVDASIRTTEAVPGVVYGYAFNISKCKGFRNCVQACIEENNLDRASDRQYIRIFEKEDGVSINDLEHADATYGHEVPAEGHYYMGTQCFQCANPPCVYVCPVQATWQEPDGIVVVDYDWCIGCRYCMAACPYWARKLSLKEKREIQSLKKELRRKEKALAETAALLVLRKKADAIWGEDEDV